jgi:fucose permease
LHGFYGLGATVSPLIATSMVTKAHLPWYYFYYLMVCPMFFPIMCIYLT